MCFVALVTNAQSFVDLGLPSGTKWKTQNQTGYYTYDSAVSKFGNRLPTQEQWEELIIECSWEWTGDGYIVIGPNGNSINIPSVDNYSCDGSNVGNSRYWSSTPYGSDYAKDFSPSWMGVYVLESMRCYRYAVRLVQNQ